MAKKEIKKNFNKIITFSGIKRFIDSPMRTYSSGMMLRLGFSVAIHSNPDILIIDEVITAGDEEFRKKSYAKMQEFFKKKKTIIFASHGLNVLQKLCSRTLWLEKGKVKLLGQSRQVVSQYLRS